MKRLIPLLLLLISGFMLNSCRDMEAPLGQGKKPDPDILLQTYRAQFESIMALTRKAKVNALHDKCYEDFKKKYTKEVLERYLKIVYYFLGPIKSYQYQNSSFDHDPALKSINYEVRYKTVFQNCDGNTSFALVCYDNKAELTDLVFHFNSFSKIKPLDDSVKKLFSLLNENGFKEAYEKSTAEFKRLNYPNYFETLISSTGQFNLEELEFTDGLIRVQESSTNISIELGLSKSTYDGLLINFIVLPNGALQLDHFEYVPS